MKEKIISTYVATVILVVLTVGIGVSLFLYFSGYLSGIVGTTEKQQQEIFECAGARLDVDYYPIGGTNLTVRVVNVGNVDLSGNFSIRVELKDEVRIVTTNQNLPSGSFFEFNVTNLSQKTVTKVTVTPLAKCQIPFSKIQEVTVK